MVNIRVVITGPVGAGKSTFVKTASEVDVVEIERNVTDSDLEALFKDTTTVAFDFGKLVLDDDKNLHIYGTPGQTRFDFMWDILIKGADAYILLIPAHKPGSLSYAKDIFSFMNDRVKVPMVIGLTHTDCAETLAVEEILQELNLSNSQKCPPILIINPQVKASVIEALNILVNQVI